MPVIPVDALVGLTFNANWSLLFNASQNEDEAKAYVINWAGELDEDAISTSEWTTDGSLTIADETNTTTQTFARLSGEPGSYRAVNSIVTVNGDSLERIIQLRIGSNSGVESDWY